MSWIPIVDIGAADAAPAIDEAASRAGFLTIVGHGVDEGVVADAWDTARAFFDLPLEQKMTVAMPAPGYPYGYSPLRNETLAASLDAARRGAGPADLKASFAIGPVDPPTHMMADPDEASAWSPNLWPDALPELRPAWERYYRELAGLSARLLGIMAEALGLPTDHFAPMSDRHTSAMRALDYRHCSRPTTNSVRARTPTTARSPCCWPTRCRLGWRSRLPMASGSPWHRWRARSSSTSATRWRGGPTTAGARRCTE